jgi:hypothetical protein
VAAPPPASGAVPRPTSEPGEAEPPKRPSGSTAVVDRDGRAKAYRPLPEPERLAALREGLDAYDRGDYFLAHELLEPAWMGTADQAERDLYQGLIKLSAGYVHAWRGNPRGMANNLRGSRARLAAALAADMTREGVDVATLVDDLDARLRRLADDAPGRTPAGARVARLLRDDPPLIRRTRA